MVHPSLAASRTRLGGVVGKRVEAQMRVVVDKACDDDNDGVGGRQMPWACPHSPWRRLGPSRGALSTGVEYQNPKKRDSGGTSSRGDGISLLCHSI